MAGWCRTGHPAVLRVLKRIADAARRSNTPVAVCGKIAYDPVFIPFLIGVGIRVLSVDPTHFSGVHRCAAKADAAAASRFAEALLQETTLSGVEALLRRKGPVCRAEEQPTRAGFLPRAFPPPALGRLA